MTKAIKSSAEMKGLSLSSQVTTDKTYVLAPLTEKVARLAVLDLGVKKATLDHLRERGLELVVMPSDSSSDEIRNQNVDALFYSNGPGDPEASEQQIMTLQKQLCIRRLQPLWSQSKPSR
jgi:carbamoyl-phosphate synthase small subunit